MTILLLLTVGAGIGLLAVQGWVLVQLLGQNGRMLLRLDALEPRLVGVGTSSAAAQLRLSAQESGAERIHGAPARAIPAVARPATAAFAEQGGAGNGVSPALTRPLGLPNGQAVPPLSLENLTGKTVTLDDFRGRETIVLFWNPGCGFCKRMVEDLKAWEAEPPADAPQLLILSTGTAETTQAMALQSPVALDPGFAVGRSFGATGTPSAVLVDAEGRIASRLARGGPAVLALAGLDRRSAASVTA